MDVPPWTPVYPCVSQRVQIAFKTYDNSSVWTINHVAKKNQTTVTAVQNHRRKKSDLHKMALVPQKNLNAILDYSYLPGKLSPDNFGRTRTPDSFGGGDENFDRAGSHNNFPCPLLLQIPVIDNFLGGGERQVGPGAVGRLACYSNAGGKTTGPGHRGRQRIGRGGATHAHRDYRRGQGSLARGPKCLILGAGLKRLWTFFLHA